MKGQDLMHALSSLPQDMLDELDEWQKSGAPLTGAEPENAAPARTAKPVITQRRNSDMKQKTPMRLRAWTAGIAAAVVLCTAAAVPVTREAVRRAQQSNAGYAESEIAEPVANASDETWIVPDGCSFLHCYASDDWKFGSFYDVMPEDTKLKAYVEDAWNLSTGRISEFCHPGAINVIPYDGYDIYFIGLPMQEAPDNLKDLALIAGTLTQSGKLHLQIGALTDAEQAVRYFESEAQQYAQADTAFVFAVPEGTLPEIREVSSSFDEIPLANFLTDAPEAESERHEWYVHLIEQNRWLVTANGEPGIRLVADEQNPDDEILTAEQPDDEEQAPENAFYAWFWTGYSGNDIPLEPRIDEKSAATVALIRTAADGEKYLTGDPEQSHTALATVLSEAWLETGSDAAEVLVDPVSGSNIAHDGMPHDVIFIGIPGDVLPSNIVRSGYHNGTVTDSGKLHLDFSVQTVSETAVKTLNAEYDNSTNFYFFISIPEGAVPTLTEWDITFSTYYTSAEPDAYTAEAPEEVGLDGMNRRESWLSKQPESESYWNSVLGAKYIYRIPEEQPDTVTPRGSFASKIEPPLEKNQLVSVHESEDTDFIMLVLPVHGPDAAAALSGLHVSADGVLSVTLNEYCKKQCADPTQDTAWLKWQIQVPHGSLPEITDIRLNRNTVSDEGEFIQLAGQLLTVTK